MPKPLRSPFNSGELDTLQALAAKANLAAKRDGTAPFYVAADGGGDAQPDGWIFMAWPAAYPPSAHMASHLFDYTAMAAYEFLGATMQRSEIQDDDGDD